MEAVALQANTTKWANLRVYVDSFIYYCKTECVYMRVETLHRVVGITFLGLSDFIQVYYPNTIH